MTDHHDRDSSFATTSSIDSADIRAKKTDFESSIESYGHVFDRERHNFTASSEVSFIDHPVGHNEENPLPVEHNRTFTKKASKTIINAFTGKPISPNPWRKLCTKNAPRQTEIDIVVSNELFSPSSQVSKERVTMPDIVSHRMTTRQSRRDLLDGHQAMNSSINEDQAFEQFLQEHRKPTEIQPQPVTPIQRRRKKRNSFRDSIDQSSSSSSENVKAPLRETLPKANRVVPNNPSLYKLEDVYTSEDSDERNHLLSANLDYTVRLKSEIYTSDQSSSSRSSTKTDSRSSLTNDDRKPAYNFLESLAERVPFNDKHSEAQPYFTSSGFQLKEKRQELADKLLSLFNQNVFSSQLSERVSVVWSGRLTATAGHCTTRKATRTAVITLSHKVCDSPERCRDTLLHEMCHAAVTLIDGVMEYGHGPRWRQWTRIAEKAYPYLPPISIRHTYDVNYKFIYRCTQCQHEVYRHSKSLNLEIDVCGKCMNTFELLVNDSAEVKQTPKKAANRYNLYVKENFQAVKQANPNLSTPQLMRQLSREYKQQNEEQQTLDMPDLDQLKL